MGLLRTWRSPPRVKPAVEILTDACADGMMTDFVCGDEVYGTVSALCGYLEDHGRG